MNRRSHLRPLVSRLATVGLVLAVLSGCGGDDPAASGDDAESSSTPASDKTDDATGDSSTSAPSEQAPSAGSKGDFATGEVALGETAVIGYSDWMAADSSPKALAVSADIKEGAISDLSDFQLDAQSKTGVPFYVSYTVQNETSKKLDVAGFAGGFTVETDSGDPVGRLTLLGDFATCEGTAKEKLAPGESSGGCDVYIVPKGETISQVSISSGDGELVWK